MTVSAWWHAVEPRILGHYRLTPEQAGWLTLDEVERMIDGIEWVSDREWTRALFLKQGDLKEANRILRFNFPHFRTPKITPFEG